MKAGPMTTRGSHKPRKFISVVASVVLTGLVVAASRDVAVAGTSDWRWGIALGFGGEGISSKQTLADGKSTKTVDRSEGPVVLGLFVETLLSDRLGLSFEHSRGVNFLPFSSGVSFTGVVSRYYFMGPAPSMVESAGLGSLLIKNFAPFFGGAVGLAQAAVQREGDPVPVVSGSGVFFGIRLGADYAQGPGYGLRAEIAASTTEYSGMFATSSSSASAPLLQEFSLGAAWYFNF